MDTACSEESVIAVRRRPEQSTARLGAAGVVTDVAVGRGSTETFAFSFEGWATAGRSVTDSTAADNLCGALWERDERWNQKEECSKTSKIK